MDLMDLKPTSNTVEVKLKHPNTGVVLKNDDKTDITAQDMEKATLDMLSKITSEWNITYNKEQPKLSFAKARDLYDEVFWIKDQIEEALADSLDFTKA